ncbi:OB-fold domain-containing protein [Candidatus Microgenomates bacterium]|nr:OB-fold domain-containing protein [Candidatus Microgenomates bacterium]
MISPVKIWRRQKVVRERLGHRGKIISWTMIMVPGGDFKDVAPYPVAIVELTDGNRAVGQIVDYISEDLTVGREVIGILRKVRKPSDDGVIAYGLKFKPI